MTTLARYTKKFAHYLRHNRAVSALEYAILVGAIAVAMAAALWLPLRITLRPRSRHIGDGSQRYDGEDPGTR